MSDLSDCLVLKLEEQDCDTGKLDTTLYVIYDKRTHHYIVRGCRRQPSSSKVTYSYSYECEFAKDLAEFIQYIICPTNTVNEGLYNYTNLSENADEITFDFLNENCYASCEIAGYNTQVLSQNKLLKVLRMLRNVYNLY